MRLPKSRHRTRERLGNDASLFDMPRLSTAISESDAPTRAPSTPPARKETKPIQTDLDRGEKNFHRLYTTDEDDDQPTKWEFKNSKHEFAPHIDTGFNRDGTIKVPDFDPEVQCPGFNPHDQLFRWPDGELRKEYPPRNPYVVARRSAVEKVVRWCRFNDPRYKESEHFRHRYNVGVLWCAHARYLTDKLGIHPVRAFTSQHDLTFDNSFSSIGNERRGCVLRIRRKL